MSELKNKSDINKLAAELLLKSTYYVSSVHSSYYMCIQLMLYIIFHKKKIKTKADFNLEVKNRSHGGSHGHAIYIIGLELANAHKMDAYKNFQNLVPKLKEYREKSDYS